MFKNASYRSRSRGFGRLIFDFLEERRLLAGDFRAGDANQDYYVDEADMIQVMKFGKYDTGEPATWAEGDWNEDGQFEVQDLIAAFQGVYRKGPYDDGAGRALNELVPLALAGEPDVSIFYFLESGNVVAIAPARMTALHLVSRSRSFGGNRGSGLLDVAAAHSQFVMHVKGVSWIEHPGLLPIGWTEEQVLDDLLVDGATLGGGGLGTVRLGARGDFPAERPEDALVTVPREPPSFVELADANALLTYDPQTGDIRIEALDLPMSLVELTSPAGLFTGTVGAKQRYVVGTFDEATPERFVRTAADAPGGVIGFTPPFTRIYLPGIARTGLSAQEFADGVHPGGVTDPRGPLKFALSLGPSFEECETHLANGSIPGDANLDGRFNSQDLVAIFQAGEYLDEISGNSTWSEGDWNCDGEFDSGDLVAAFKAGNYELPAAASALRRWKSGEPVPPVGQADGAGRIKIGLEGESDGTRRAHDRTATSTNFASRRVRWDLVRASATDEVMADREFLAK